MKGKMFDTFRAARVEDVDLISLHPVFSKNKSCKDVVKTYIQSSFNISYTILDKNGKPIAITGGFFLYDKVMEIWTIVDKKVFEIPIYYSRAMLFLLNKCFSIFDVNRMQIHVMADQPWAEHWGKFLGFTKEGLLKKYGPEGVDYFLFAKVRS